MKRFSIPALVLASIAGLAFAGDCGKQSSCTDGSKSDVKITKASYKGDKDKAAKQDIVDTAVGVGNFKTLAAALQAAGLVETLKGKGPFTVFAPTDAAFEKLGTATINDLLKPENKAKLAAILTYHVVPGRVLAKDVTTTSVATANGQRIELVVKDGKVTIDNANVTATDVLASNGVIHVIDTVILPNDQTIVGTAVANGKFTTLAKLLQAADLVETLNGSGPFTVFAPTDEAFAKLDKATVESLLKPENKSKLQEVLKYHVVSGRVFSDAALKAGHAKTLQGESVKIKVEQGSAKIDNAKLIATDIDTTNGVIHVVDTVLMPN
ncbi:MAG TPA: fasciclin domain-containing protein [Phycisphaerales bacterium]